MLPNQNNYKYQRKHFIFSSSICLHSNLLSHIPTHEHPSTQRRKMNDIPTSESTLTLADGHELYTKTWTPIPSTTTRARLVWLHGFSDHCNWYDELFCRYAAQGIKVYSFDQRGWGRSVHKPSQRGLTGDTAAVMADITAFVRSVLEDESGKPLFLGGHSMGGGEALTYLATGPREVVGRIRGVLVESPFLAQPPASRASAVTVMLGKAASRLMPGRQMVQKLDKKYMSRDQDVCDAWEADELCHDTGTLEGLKGLLERGAGLTEGRVVVKEGLGEGGKTRLWVGHGTADSVADLTAVRTWFEGLKVEDKEMVVYEGWYHKLHSEPGQDKVRFAEETGKWILDRSAAMGSEDRPKL